MNVVRAGPRRSHKADCERSNLTRVLTLALAVHAHGCIGRAPLALPEPATVREPGELGPKVASAAMFAPDQDGTNVATQQEGVGQDFSGLIFNAQGSIAIGVVKGCEVSPAMGPIIPLNIDLGVKCQLTPSEKRLSLAFGLGGRTYRPQGLFTNYSVRSGLYASYRDDTALFMLGMHLGYGEQIYFQTKGVGEWNFDSATYAGREMRLAIPVGIGPLASTEDGVLWSFGAVLTGVLNHGSAYRFEAAYQAQDAGPPDRRMINAPVEFALVLQIDWGRPIQERARKKIRPKRGDKVREERP